MTEPAPAGRPVGRPLLVYDADCAFCTRAARVAHDRLGVEHVEAWQTLDLDSLGLTADACAAAVQWVTPDGAVVSAERAVIAALRHAGGAWRAVGALLALPGVRGLAAVGYRLVARYRHRMPGGSDACRLPPP